MSTAMTDAFEKDVHDAINRAYPQLSKEELSSSVGTFLGYIDIVNEIYNGLSDDSERYAAAARLTASLSQVTVEPGQVEPTHQANPPFDA